MTRTWAVLDVPYLGYRAAHSQPEGLWFRGEPTTVAFGLFREMEQLNQRFPDLRFVFCFEGRGSLRRKIYRQYKLSRNELTKEQLEFKQLVRYQLEKVRDYWLREIGFENIFWQDGYEADDWVAVVCSQMGPGARALMVSGDQDLYQLLGRRVAMWEPRKQAVLTESKFRKQYGICPTMWADVKAIAGCPGDNVPGIGGIGPKRAIAYLTAVDGPQSRYYERIVQGVDIWTRNEQLVRLPFPGLTAPKLSNHQPVRADWAGVLRKLGIRRL